MSKNINSWPRSVAAGAVALLAACAQTPPPAVASNPPPVPPGPAATWTTVAFDTNSVAINTGGLKVVADAADYLQRHPNSVATFIGRIDTVGTANYNMRLSHRRSDAVRDALVYDNHIAPGRVEARWTGESRHGMPTGDPVAAAQNRAVDIAIH